MNSKVLIVSLTGLLLLGIGCWIYGELLPRNAIFDLRWLTFCWISASLGAAQIIAAAGLLVFKKAGLLRWQLFISGLLWLLIGGAVCGVPMLFSSVTK